MEFQELWNQAGKYLKEHFETLQKREIIFQVLKDADIGTYEPTPHTMSFQDALEKLVALFEQETGERIVL